MLSSFEEENIVTGVEVRKCIECRIVVIGRFGVKLGVFVGVWKKKVKVVQEVSMSTRLSVMMGSIRAIS